MNSNKTILIIGISGGLAQILCNLLRKSHPEARIIGIDSRPPPNLPKDLNIEIYSFSYSRGNFEKLFRDIAIDVVYHLGRMSHVSANPKAILARRLDLNVMGTKRILDLALKSKVKKIIVLSTFHVYGAFPDNPALLHEDAPLRASFRHPELRDVVEMDQLTTTWMWQHKDEIETVVLRPCNIVGPKIKNAISTYLSTNFVPVGIDYNPMMQFIHELDMARVLTRCAETVPTGIYNIAPTDFIPIREAFKTVGKIGVPVPLSVVSAVASFINQNLRSIPDYLIDYLRFSCTISGDQIKKYLGDDFFQFNTKDALLQLKIY